AIAAGLCNVALVTYGSTAASERFAIGTGTGGFVLEPPDSFEAPFGPTIVGSYALVARRHMHEYGTTGEQLAEIAVTMRRHAGLNPRAKYREPITVEDVLASRMISSPLHLLDCCVISDGGGALVLTSVERARDLRRPPVVILGAAEALRHAGHLPRHRGDAAAARRVRPAAGEGCDARARPRHGRHARPAPQRRHSDPRAGVNGGDEGVQEAAPARRRGVARLVGGARPPRALLPALPRLRHEALLPARALPALPLVGDRVGAGERARHGLLLHGHVPEPGAGLPRGAALRAGDRRAGRGRAHDDQRRRLRARRRPRRHAGRGRVRRRHGGGHAAEVPAAASARAARVSSPRAVREQRPTHD